MQYVIGGLTKNFSNSENAFRKLWYKFLIWPEFQRYKSFTVVAAIFKIKCKISKSKPNNRNDQVSPSRNGFRIFSLQ